MMNKTWEDIIKDYPGRWVALKNADMDGPDVISGEVVDVKTDDEICDYEDDHMMDGLVFRRTTEEPWSGIITAGLGYVCKNES